MTLPMAIIALVETSSIEIQLSSKDQRARGEERGLLKSGRPFALWLLLPDIMNNGMFMKNCQIWILGFRDKYTKRKESHKWIISVHCICLHLIHFNASLLFPSIFCLFVLSLQPSAFRLPFSRPPSNSAQKLRLLQKGRTPKKGAENCGNSRIDQ